MRVVISYGLPAASAALNVLYARLTGATSDENVLDDWSDWLTNVWGVDWSAFGATTASIIGLAVDVVDFEGHVLANIGSETFSIPGTVATDPTSAGDAAYMKADTAIPKTRGSKYVPGLAEDNVDAGVLDVTILGELAILLVDYLTNYTGVASGKVWEMGVPSRTLLAFQPFTGGGTFTDIIAYQRRRKLNVGS